MFIIELVIRTCLIAVLFCVSAQVQGDEVGNTNPNYDENLAKKLGADEYGMKKFIFVVLKTGSNKTTDKTFISKKFSGHMTNINRLVEEGKLIVAGPFAKNEQQFRGLFILDVADEKKAKELLNTDPAIEAKLLSAEIFTWYGSAALATYLDASDKVWKKSP